MDEKNFLTSEIYYKWKLHLEKINNAKINYQVQAASRKIMEQEIIIKKLEMELFKKTLRQASEVKVLAESQYKEVLEELENHLGFEFKDCVVNDETLEVIKNDDLEKPVE